MKSIFVLLLSCLVVTGCKSNAEVSKGNGNVVSYEVPIGDYSKINLTGSCELIYEQKANQEPYLKVEIDENLRSNLDVSVKRNTLSIALKGNNIRITKYRIITNSRRLAGINTTGSGNVLLKGKLDPDRFGVSMTGSATIKTEDLHSNDLKVSITGSGKLVLAGKANNSKFSISGSGKVDAINLISKNADCNISGSGNIKVYATEALKARISGSGVISYKGSPSRLDKQVSGWGSIKAE